MALSNNAKMAVMGLHNPCIPINAYMTIDGITQPDQQQLIWGYPDIAYVAGAAIGNRKLYIELSLGLMIGG